MSQHYSVIIVGAGLSGLHSAWLLQQANVSVLVLEARDRTGGRALSPNQCDLGAAWVWPAIQPRLKSLLSVLNIKTMPQFIDGDTFFQLSRDQIERYNDESPHAHSYRIKNGVESMTLALTAALKPETIKLNSTVKKIISDTSKVTIELNNEGEPLTADHIILALPPRVWLQNIVFKPKLNDRQVVALNAVPTWMATQAKVVIVYEKAFWREQNLSGEAMSHCGPLREISDACSDDGSIAALSAFVGISGEQRKQLGEQALIDVCLNQLKQFFGEKALKPMFVQFKDWESDELSCSQLDLKTPSQHPQYAAHQSREFWDGQLILSGSELATEHGGYLEGAIESSLYAVQQLNQRLIKENAT